MGYPPIKTPTDWLTFCTASVNITLVSVAEYDKCSNDAKNNNSSKADIFGYMLFAIQL